MKNRYKKKNKTLNLLNQIYSKKKLRVGWEATKNLMLLILGAYIFTSHLLYEWSLKCTNSILCRKIRPPALLKKVS